MNTLKAPCSYEEVIRKSRFIAHASPVSSEADTLAFFESVCDPQASHNCWAWRQGGRYRFNDDGEPAGSAGRPILAALEGRELDGVMIVVTRQFGGIKLGVGGLIRAYGGCAAKCLDRGVIQALELMVIAEARVDFSLVSAMHRLIETHQGRLHHEHFEDLGAVLRFELPKRHQDEIKRALDDISRGRARISFRRGPG